MDPFGSVLQDAEGQLGSAQLLLRQYKAEPTSEKLADLHNLIKDISETIRDLSESIAAVQARPEQYGFGAAEIERRIEQVGHINNQVTDIQQALASIREQPRRAPPPSNKRANFDLEAQQDRSGEPLVSEEDRQMLFQSTIHEQDNILDEVEQTVANLREQANVMSQELDDQADLIDDFETQVDHSNDRVKRGLQRVGWVLRNNRDTMSSCWIGLLTIVLVILLVLVVVT